MSAPSPARKVEFPTGRSVLRAQGKLLALGVLSGAVVLTVFLVAGIDPWWFRLLIAGTMTVATIWLQIDSRRPKHIDVPAGMSEDEAAGYRVGVLSSQRANVGPFLLVYMAWAWTKVFDFQIKWTGVAFAIVWLALALWFHVTMSDETRDVPPLFIKDRELYAEFVEDVRRIERNMYFGLFVVFAVVATAAWLLD